MPQLPGSRAPLHRRADVAHLPAGEREKACINWHAREGARFGDLTWWEFAAAAGLQFQVYAPLYTAFCSEFERIGEAYDAYFPAFSALHVLLDSFIDQQEDRAHGDLNWMDCYERPARFRERALQLALRARAAFAKLSMPRAHLFALRVMMLFYLTHPKIYRQKLDREVYRAPRRPGINHLCAAACRVMRRRPSRICVRSFLRLTAGRQSNTSRRKATEAR